MIQHASVFTRGSVYHETRKHYSVVKCTMTVVYHEEMFLYSGFYPQL